MEFLLGGFEQWNFFWGFLSNGSKTDSEKSTWLFHSCSKRKFNSNSSAFCFRSKSSKTNSGKMIRLFELEAEVAKRIVNFNFCFSIWESKRIEVDFLFSFWSGTSKTNTEKSTSVNWFWGRAIFEGSLLDTDGMPHPVGGVVGVACHERHSADPVNFIQVYAIPSKGDTGDRQCDD